MYESEAWGVARNPALDLGIISIQVVAELMIAEHKESLW